MRWCRYLPVLVALAALTLCGYAAAWEGEGEGEDCNIVPPEVAFLQCTHTLDGNSLGQNASSGGTAVLTELNNPCSFEVTTWMYLSHTVANPTSADLYNGIPGHGGELVLHLSDGKSGAALLPFSFVEYSPESPLFLVISSVEYPAGEIGGFGECCQPSNVDKDTPMWPNCDPDPCEIDPASWVYNPNNGHWYKLTDSAGTWPEVKAMAAAQCGFLVAIESYVENTWLLRSSGLLDAQGELWIGLNDIASEGVYVWDNGVGFVYTNWGASEPNNLGDEDHGAILGSSQPANLAGTWNDNGATDTFKFFGIIEREPVPWVDTGDGEHELFSTGFLSADKDANGAIYLSELLRTIQFYNLGGLHCADNPGDSEDGYLPGSGANMGCRPYDTDYRPQDWVITLSELLRLVQIYNSDGYYYCPDNTTEDGFCPD